MGRLLTTSSIPRLAMRLLCSWERQTFISYWGRAMYLLWWPNLTKELQAEPKKVLRVGEVRQTQTAWLIRTSQRVLLEKAKLKSLLWIKK